MMGFEEAYEYSILVRICSDPILDIKLPTLPGLVLMKLISWEEKYPERKLDADDILFIMNNYNRADVENRLYEDEIIDLLKESEFNIRKAGIQPSRQ